MLLHLGSFEYYGRLCIIIFSTLLGRGSFISLLISKAAVLAKQFKLRMPMLTNFRADLFKRDAGHLWVGCFGGGNGVTECPARRYAVGSAVVGRMRFQQILG